MSERMKALVYTDVQTMTYRDEPLPMPATGESLIKIEAAGICGSDMHAWHGHDARRQPPIILGHEVAGTVIDGAKTGARVTMNPLIVCGTCEYCLAGKDNLCSNRTMIGMTRPGAFAQYITIPDRCLVPMDDQVSFAVASLTEPAAVCLHAINVAKQHRNIRDLADQRILVIGAGSVGIITTLLLRMNGASNVVIAETNPHRRLTAKQATGMQVIDPLERPAKEKSFHTVFDCVGSTPTRAASLQAVKDAGCVVHVGLQQAEGNFDARRVTLGEISFCGVYTYTMAEFRESLDLLSNADLGDFHWLHEDALEGGGDAFKAIDQGNTLAAKIVLRPEH